MDCTRRRKRFGVSTDAGIVPYMATTKTQLFEWGAGVHEQEQRATDLGERAAIDVSEELADK